MAGGREMADMVVDEIRRRVAQPLAACAAVEGRRNAKLDAFLPHGVVIVRAVDRQHVIRYREALAFRIVGRSCRDIPLPNMPTFEPSCLVTNSSSAIASSGWCIGMIAAGVSRSSRPWKYSAETML